MLKTLAIYLGEPEGQLLQDSVVLCCAGPVVVSVECGAVYRELPLSWIGKADRDK